MDERSAQAARALYDGNFDAVINHLHQRTTQGHVSVVDLWMMAFAIEDEEEREQLLKQVKASGKRPYAEMAAEILKREHDFAAEMEKAPPLQAWFIRNKRRINMIIITMVVFIGTVLIVAWMFTPPEESQAIVVQRTAVSGTQVAINATETIVALTPTVTPTAAIRSVGQQSYPPIGRIEVISHVEVVPVGDTFNLAIGQSNTLRQPASGFRFVALQYTFTCQNTLDNLAYCDAPGASRAQDAIQVRLNNGRNIPWDGLTVMGEMPTGRTAIGASFTGWLAFQIPDNTTVEALILQVETRVDANNRPVAEEVVVPLAPPQR